MKRTRFVKVEIYINTDTESELRYKVRLELFKYTSPKEVRLIHKELRELAKNLDGFYWYNVDTGEAVFKTKELAEQFKNTIEMVEYHWTEKVCKNRESYKEVMSLVEDFGGITHSIHYIASGMYNVIASFPNQEQLKLFNAAYNLTNGEFNNSDKC